MCIQSSEVILIDSPTCLIDRNLFLNAIQERIKKESSSDWNDYRLNLQYYQELANIAVQRRIPSYVNYFSQSPEAFSSDNGMI